MIISTQLAAPCFLMVTILSCWLGRVWLTGILIAITLTTGLYTGTLAGLALPALGCLALSGWCSVRGLNLPVRVIGTLVFVILSVGLAHHQVPGFDNVLVWDRQSVKTASAPFTLYYNMDKPWIGLVLLLVCVPLLKAGQWFRSFEKSVLPILIMLPALFSIGLLSGFVRWQPEWPALGFWFLINNLVFTAVAEECFFRGFIQKGLTGYLQRYNLNPVFGIILASLLFGLAHYAGGIIYVGLASLAGCFYGWIYHRSDSIEMAILGHWLLNTCHFVLFSYPLAA